MKRVLFVDDDPGVLAGLRRMLRPHRREWDMVFAIGGEAAQAELERAPFDVVVTDMRMPGIDGAALLAFLRERHPATVRIVLSGHTELSAALRSVPVAHQFLSKPCDREVLVSAVHRACALEERLRHPTLRRLLGEMAALPSPPHVVVRLNQALAETHPSLDTVADVVAADPAMSAKLLQLVNSAFFGVAHRVTSVREAVGYLGIDMVRALAVAVEAFGSFQGALPETFGSAEVIQTHSIQVAHLAMELAAPAQAQDAFTAGLLHEVGILALASSAPELLAALHAEMHRTRKPLAEVEAAIIGASHADIGAYLLSLWGLPYSVVEAVAEHHRAPTMPHRHRDAIHSTFIAEALLDTETTTRAVWEHRVDTLDPVYVAELGLTDMLARREREVETGRRTL